jgi:hypothetical protein
MTPKERYQAKLHRKRLDENYLQKQLIKLNENKSETLMRILNFKSEHNRKYNNSKEIYLHQQQVVKLLNTNKRTVDLLTKDRLIKNNFGFVKPTYKLSEVLKFIHSINSLLSS